MLSINDLSGTGRFAWEKDSSEKCTWHVVTPTKKRTLNFKHTTPGDYSSNGSTKGLQKFRLLAPKSTITKYPSVMKGAQSLNLNNSKRQGSSSAPPVVIEIVDSPEPAEYDLSLNENLNRSVEFDHHTEELDTSRESNQVPGDCSILFEVAGISILLKNSAGIDRTKLSRDGDTILYWSRPFYLERAWDFFGNELKVPQISVPVPVQNKMVIIPTLTGEMTVTLQNSADINTDLLKVIDNTIVYFPGDFFEARSWDICGNECAVPNICLPVPDPNKIVSIQRSTGEMNVELQNSADINTDLLRVRDDKIVYFPADLFAAARSWDFSGKEC